MKHSIIVVSAALSALLVIALMLGLIAAGAAPGDHPDFGWFFQARVMFVLVLLCGIGPTLLVFAPAYIALGRTGHARWPYALLIGIAPGVLLAIFISPMVGIPMGMGGAVVALSTHLLCRKLRPDGAAVPNPPSGAG